MRSRGPASISLFARATTGAFDAGAECRIARRFEVRSRAAALATPAVGNSHLLRSLCVAGALLMTTSAGFAGGLTIEIEVDGDSPVQLVPRGIPIAEPFVQQYAGFVNFDGTSVGWQITGQGATGSPSNAKLVGTVNIANTSMVPREFVVTLRHAAMTACPTDNQMGGAAFATLLLDLEGGGVSSPVAAPMWRALIDDVVVATLFADLQLESAAWGTLLVGPESFGDPIPSDPAPGVAKSIGLRYCFTLTGGETFSVSSIFFVAFLDLDCPVFGDIDGDGVVDGADLGLLLAAWGTDDPFADLNGDGNVDGADLGLLLQAWS